MLSHVPSARVGYTLDQLDDEACVKSCQQGASGCSQKNVADGPIYFLIHPLVDLPDGSNGQARVGVTARIFSHAPGKPMTSDSRPRALSPDFLERSYKDYCIVAVAVSTRVTTRV